MLSKILRERRSSPVRFGGHGWELSVWWIHDQRRSAYQDRFPPFKPELVRVAIYVGVCSGPVAPVHATPRTRLPFRLCQLLVCQELLPCQRSRSFQRRPSSEVPHSLQVGIAPRCSSRRLHTGRSATRLCVSRSHQQHNAHNDQDRVPHFGAPLEDSMTRETQRTGKLATGVESSSSRATRRARALSRLATA